MRKIGQKLKRCGKKYQKAILAFAIIFVIGVIIGGVISGLINADKLESVRQSVNLQSVADYNGSFVAAVWGGLKKYIFPLVLVLFFGFFAVCIPLIFAEVAIKGVKIGFSIGVMTRLFGLKGFGYAVCSTVFQNLIFIPCLIILAVISVRNALGVKREKKKKFKRIGKFGIVALGGVFLIALLCGVCEGTAAKYMIAGFFR